MHEEFATKKSKIKDPQYIHEVFGRHKKVNDGLIPFAIVIKSLMPTRLRGTSVT